MKGIHLTFFFSVLRVVRGYLFYVYTYIQKSLNIYTYVESLLFARKRTKSELFLYGIRKYRFFFWLAEMKEPVRISRGKKLVEIFKRLLLPSSR